MLFCSVLSGVWYLTSPGCISPSESAGSGGVLAVTLFLRSPSVEV